jgi:acetylglutamate kinase
MISEQIIKRAEALIEALPYIQQFRGKSLLVKIGGSAMEDRGLTEKLMRDVVFLHAVGMKPVVVHGGGKAITARMREAGIRANFVSGLRVTDEASIRVVEETLEKVVQLELVENIRHYGAPVAAISGKKVFHAEKLPDRPDEEGNMVDLGFVGEAVEIDPGPVQEALDKDQIPVVTPIGSDKDGQTYNINADSAAGALARQLRVSKCVFISDVPGIMRDPAHADSLISTVNKEMVDKLIKEGIIKGGMLPKVESALKSLESGVGKIHFIDGRISHSLLLEILTPTGIGTQIVGA